MSYSSKYQGKTRDSGLKYSEFVNKMFIECDDKMAILEKRLRDIEVELSKANDNLDEILLTGYIQ